MLKYAAAGASSREKREPGQFEPSVPGQNETGVVIPPSQTLLHRGVLG